MNSNNGSDDGETDVPLGLKNKIACLTQKRGKLKRRIDNGEFGSVKTQENLEVIHDIDCALDTCLRLSGWNIQPDDTEIIEYQHEEESLDFPEKHNVNEHQQRLRGGLNDVLVRPLTKTPLIPGDIAMKVDEWNTKVATAGYNKAMDALGWE